VTRLRPSLSRPTLSRPVRVLHTAGALHRGGIESWLYNTLVRMDRSRIESHVLVPNGEQQELTRQYQDAGITLSPCEDYRRPWRYIRNFRRALERNGPYDIIHVHGFSFGSAENMLLARLTGIRTVIIHSHSNLRSRIAYAGPAYRVYAHALRFAHRSLMTQGLACSSLAAEWLFGSNWQHDARIRLHYSGIDPAPFLDHASSPTRSDLSIPPGRFVLGHVGRFEPMKNHRFLLDVASELLARGFPLHLLLVGDGSLAPAIQREAANRGLDDHCTFIRDSDQVPTIMRNAMDCFLFPSLHEGLGLVSIEAQAAGLPCIVSTAVTRELVIAPELVHFLPVDRGAHEWADAIIDLERSNRCATPTAEYQKRLTASPFNMDRTARDLADYYERLIPVSLRIA
jgi:glycosyltransferase involved in cell wall biosynthesis